MSSDNTYRTKPDVKFRPAGTGVPYAWLCLGCNKPRSMLGRRGVGVKKRCAVCVAAKTAA